MSKYTTEVRFICESAAGLTESAGYKNTNQVITDAIPSIFDFDFPIFDEAYRVILERKILKHFYTREIGQETVGLWKLKLDTKMNEIMPYYNKLYASELLQFNPLYTTDLTRKKDNEITGQNEGKVDSTNSSTSNGTGTGTNSGTSRDKYSDTPQGALTNVENGTYLTNARITEDSATNSSTSSNTSSGSGNVTSEANSLTTEDYLEHVVGYESRSASKLLKEYRETFLNIDMMIINDLEELFMQLW